MLDPNGAPLVVSRAEIATMVAAEVRRERADEALRQREARTQVSVERLVQEKCMELEGGRPSITLPAPVARMILDDHKAGHSISAIWRKYSVYYPFSRAWLTPNPPTGYSGGEQTVYAGHGKAAVRLGPQ